MKRAAAIVLIAVLMAAVSGIDATSLARDQQAAQPAGAQAQAIAARARRIGINRVVRIERTDGTRLNGLIETIAADAITVTSLERDNRRSETIPFAEIKRLDEVRGHALRNVLIGVGIGVAVLVGTCAAALNSVESPRSSH
jgi:hypothetical protein